MKNNLSSVLFCLTCQIDILHGIHAGLKETSWSFKFIHGLILKWHPAVFIIGRGPQNYEPNILNKILTAKKLSREQ